jgi:MbtH protein
VGQAPGDSHRHPAPTEDLASVPGLSGCFNGERSGVNRGKRATSSGIAISDDRGREKNPGKERVLARRRLELRFDDVTVRHPGLGAKHYVQRPPKWVMLSWSPLNGATTVPMAEQDDTVIYQVVVNHEEQYSIWPADRENAVGWRNAGKQGIKAECLEYIRQVWTDMRPLSLRRQMAKQEKEG